jgi:hypothetical protein
MHSGNSLNGKSFVFELANIEALATANARGVVDFVTFVNHRNGAAFLAELTVCAVFWLFDFEKGESGCEVQKYRERAKVSAENPVYKKGCQKNNDRNRNLK